MLPITETLECPGQSEVHRAHVERTHLRLQRQWPGQPFFGQHKGGATSRDINHSVDAVLDARQKLPENFGILGRSAVLRVAGMQMQDCGTSFGCADRAGSNFVGRNRQVRRHRWCMDRTGDGAGDDNFFRHF